MPSENNHQDENEEGAKDAQVLLPFLLSALAEPGINQSPERFLRCARS